MNTRLLAGEPVDLIVLDNLPAQQYAQQGLLANMADTVDTSDFQGSFAEQLKTGDSLYYVPLGWFVPAMRVRTDAIKKIPASFEAWIDFIEKTAPYDEDYFIAAQEAMNIDEGEEIKQYNIPLDKMSFSLDDLQPIYDMLWAANEPALIENNKINEKNMKSFLKMMKLLADKNGLNTEEY